MAQRKQHKNMGLLDTFRINFKKNTLDKIKSAFAFLLTDFGFKLVGTEESDEYIGKYLVTYRNIFIANLGGY
jgi:hypothetical protein